MVWQVAFLLFLPIVAIALESHSPQDYYTYPSKSIIPGAGLGLFAKRFIPRGTEWFIGSDKNALFITPTTHFSLKNSMNNSEQSKTLYEMIILYAYCDPFSHSLVLSMDQGRYVNHSNKPNSELSTENPYTSVALRDIQEGEEIVEDYHTLYDHNCTSVIYRNSIP